MHRPHNLYEMYHVRPCKPSKSPNDANTSYLYDKANTSILVYADVKNTLRLPRIQHYRKEQYLEAALRPDAYRRQSTANYIISMLVRRDESGYYIVHTVHKLRTRSEVLETRRVQFDIPYELANLDLPNRLSPLPMPHQRRVIGWTIPDVANEFTEHYMEYSTTRERCHIFDYDAVVLYNWHTITSTHIRRLTQLVAKDAVAIYLRLAEKHHALKSHEDQEVYLPIPTIATLSNLLQSPNRRHRRQTIKTLLAMGIRWHPSYSTYIERHNGSKSIPAIYSTKHRHEVYHSYILKTGFKPIYFNPFKMIACDVILMVTICTTVEEYHLPPEIRLILLSYIDLLSILPSINSVQRYLHAMYF